MLRFLGRFSIGILLLVMIASFMKNISEFFDKHFVSILCLIGAIIAVIAYIRTPTDDDSNAPLPPEKFNG